MPKRLIEKAALAVNTGKLQKKQAEAHNLAQSAAHGYQYISTAAFRKDWQAFFAPAPGRSRAARTAGLLMVARHFKDC